MRMMFGRSAAAGFRGAEVLSTARFEDRIPGQNTRATEAITAKERPMAGDQIVLRKRNHPARRIATTATPSSTTVAAIVNDSLKTAGHSPIVPPHASLALASRVALAMAGLPEKWPVSVRLTLQTTATPITDAARMPVRLPCTSDVVA